MSEQQAETENKEAVKNNQAENNEGGENQNNLGDSAQKSEKKKDELTISVYGVQQQRKQIVQDNETLKNRIARLETEQKLLERKIKETDITATKVYTNKKAFSSKIAERKRKQIEVEEVPFTSPKGQLQMLKCKLNQQESTERKKATTEELKTTLAADYFKRQNQIENQVEYNKVKVSYAREAYSESRNRIKQKNQDKIDKVAFEQKCKMDLEHDCINVNAAQLKALETIETQWLSKLANTQNQLKVTKEKEQFAQTKGARDFEEKYNAPGLTHTKINEQGKLTK